MWTIRNQTSGVASLRVVRILLHLGTQMKHGLSSFTTTWVPSVSTDVQFGHHLVARKNLDSMEQWQYSTPVPFLPLPISIEVVPSLDWHKELQSVILVPWRETKLSSCHGGRLQSPSATVYAVQTPTGLSEDGELGTTFGDMLQDEGLRCLMTGTTIDGDPENPVNLGSMQDVRDAGFKGGGTHHGTEDVAFGQYDLITAISGVGPVDWWNPEWEAFEADVADLADKEHVLYIVPIDEPFYAGIDSKYLYEALYRARKVNTRQPFMISEEPTLVNSKELYEVQEVAGDNEYTVRAASSQGDWHYPQCAVTTRLEELVGRMRDGVASHLYLLGGYYETPEGGADPRWITVTRDQTGLQVLACAIMDLDVASLFVKLHKLDGETIDLATENGPWNDYSELGANVWEPVSRWMRDTIVYDAGYAGESVPECEQLPLVYAYGSWTEELGNGLIGTWVAVGNTAYRDTQSIDISWESLSLYENIVGNYVLEVDSESHGESGFYNLVQGQGLHCLMPPEAWMVGRIVGVVEDVAGVQETKPLQAVLEVRPTIFSSETVLSLHSSSPRELSVRILSVGGRLIRSLEDVHCDGVVEVTWDGRDSQGREVPNGMYLVRVQDELQSIGTTRCVLRID